MVDPELCYKQDPKPEFKDLGECLEGGSIESWANGLDCHLGLLWTDIEIPLQIQRLEEIIPIGVTPKG
jgi:hypothetical protein